MHASPDVEIPSTQTLQNYIALFSQKRFDVDKKQADGELEMMKPRFMATDKYNRQLSFWTSLRDLRPFGPGVYFLFYAMRYFMVVFLIMAMMSVVPLVVFVRGSGLAHSPGVPRWLKTTITNSEGKEIDNNDYLIFKEQLTAVNENFPTDSEEVNWLRSIMEAKNLQVNLDLQVTLAWNCSLIIVFILAIYAFKYLVLKERLEVESECTSISKFALRLSQLPNEHFDKTDVKEFIRQFYSGKIIDINFAYKFNDSLHEIVETGDMKVDLQHLSTKPNRTDGDEVRMNGYKKRIHANRQMIEKKLKMSDFSINEIDDRLEKIAAFVIFNESNAPKKILELTENNPDELLFKGAKLKLSIPDDVRDINFKNLDKPNKVKFYKLLVAVVICLAIIGGFLTLTLTIEHKFESLLPHYDCTHHKGITYAQVVGGHLNGLASSNQVYCFCKKFYGRTAESAIKDFCLKNNQKVNKFYYFSIFLIVLIEVVNLILTVVIEQVMKITHFASKTNKFTVSLLIFFAMIYLNTVLSVVISSDLIFGPTHPQENLGKLISTKIKDRILRTFDPEWFEVFGYKMILLVFVLVLFPHVFMLAYVAIRRKINDYRATKAQTHQQYLHLKKPFKFALAEYYVMILNVIFCTMTFAAGMPVLMILAFVAFAVMYPTTKKIFVSYSAKPHFLKPLAVQLIIKLLPLSVVIHLIIAIILYGNHFKHIDFNDDKIFDPTNPFDYVYVSRSFVWFQKCLPLTIILLVFIVVNLLEFLVYKLIKNRLKSYFSQTKSKVMIYKEKLDALKYWSGVSYDFRMLPKFASLLIDLSAKQVKSVNVMQSLMPVWNENDVDGDTQDCEELYLSSAVKISEGQFFGQKEVKNVEVKRLETIKEHASFAEDYDEERDFGQPCEKQEGLVLTTKSTLTRIGSAFDDLLDGKSDTKLNVAHSNFRL
jgi:hypothetical protein